MDQEDWKKLDGKARGQLLRDLVFEAYEELGENRRATRVRPSEAGEQCARKSWLKFRWADKLEPIGGRLYRLFETGHSQEDRLVDDLKKVGAIMHVKDPSDSSKQIPVELLDGHSKGYLDGVAENLPFTVHPFVLFEAKSHNKASFNKLVKEGVESIPKHYAQTQIYMHEHELKETIYSGVCKDNDDLYFEFVSYNKDYAARLLSKMKRTVTQDMAPEKINRNPEYFECKFCSARGVCQLGELPERNCRTCQFCTPGKDGTWHCHLHEQVLTLDDQRTGCMQHRYNLNLLDGLPTTEGTFVLNATGEVLDDQGPAHDGREAAE